MPLLLSRGCLMSKSVVYLRSLLEKDWMTSAGKNKGGLHRSLGIPEGEDIPLSKIYAALDDGSSKVKKQARLALTYMLNNKNIPTEKKASIRKHLSEGDYGGEVYVRFIYLLLL